MGAQSPLLPRQGEASVVPRFEPTVLSPFERLDWGLALGTQGLTA